MPLIFYYNEVGTEVLVINDLLIYCRPQFVLSSTKLPNKHIFKFSTFGLDISGLLAVGQFNNVITLLIN